MINYALDNFRNILDTLDYWYYQLIYDGRPDSHSSDKRRSYTYIQAGFRQEGCIILPGSISLIDAELSQQGL